MPGHAALRCPGLGPREECPQPLRGPVRSGGASVQTRHGRTSRPRTRSPRPLQVHRRSVRAGAGGSRPRSLTGRPAQWGAPRSKAALGAFILLTKLKIQDGNRVVCIKDEKKISVSRGGAETTQKETVRGGAPGETRGPRPHPDPHTLPAVSAGVPLPPRGSTLFSPPS